MRAAALAQQADTLGQNYKVGTSNGELEIVGTDTQYDIILPTDVLFDFDKADVRPEGLKLLEKTKQHSAKEQVSELYVWGTRILKAAMRANDALWP